jgi:hypothetical protein
MKDSDCPLASGDFCVERRELINNLTVKDIFKLHGTNANTAQAGEERWRYLELVSIQVV